MRAPEAAALGHLRVVAGGAGLGLAGGAWSAVSGVALVGVVSRGLTAHDAGVFYACTATFLLVVAAASLGSETGLARFVLALVADRPRRELRDVLLVGLLPVGAATVLFSAGMVVAPLALGLDGQTTGLVIVLGAGLPFAVTADVALGAVRSFGDVGPTVRLERVARPTAQLAGVLVAVVLTPAGATRTTWVCVAWVAVYGVVAVGAVRALRRTLRAHGLTPDLPRGVGDLPARVAWASYWSFTAPRAVSRVLQSALQRLDVLLVAVLLGPPAAAAYTVATRFVVLGQVAVQALQQVLQPRFTAILAARGSHRILSEVFSVTTSWTVVLVWPWYVVVALAPQTYLGLFHVPDDVPGDPTLVVAVMALAMMFAVATGPVDTLLLMSGGSLQSLLNVIIALSVDVVLCLVLAPRWGIVGAAVAWGTAVAVRSVLGVAQVARRTSVLPRPKELLPAFVVALSVAPPFLAARVLGTTGPVATVIAALLSLASFALLAYSWRARLSLDTLSSRTIRTPTTSRPAEGAVS